MELPVPLAFPVTSSPLPSYWLLCKRLRRLGLREDTLEGLRTFGQVQVRAKRAYHALAHQYHPDRRAQQHPRERPLQGRTFDLITRAYQWLMAFPPTASLPVPKSYTLHYDTPPIYECDLPFALQRRPLPIPEGFQESYEHL